MNFLLNKQIFNKHFATKYQKPPTFCIFLTYLPNQIIIHLIIYMIRSSRKAKKIRKWEKEEKYVLKNLVVTD